MEFKHGWLFSSALRAGDGLEAVGASSEMINVSVSNSSVRLAFDFRLAPLLRIWDPKVLGP